MVELKSFFQSLKRIEKQMKAYELMDDDPEMKMKALENIIKELDLIGDAALEGIKDATDLLKKIGSEDVGKRIEKLTEIN
ncbi:hypothetical protein ACTHPT_14650 [Bacillus altitudinis]|uniref:hypothetical protein n=1 Tax=Bacillus altitudinis TaxID=293387 RepID=UPI003F7BE354